MSTHQDLIPEPHTRTSKRISKDRQKDILYITYIYIYIERERGSHKIFIQELPLIIPEELSYKHPFRMGPDLCLAPRSWFQLFSLDFNWPSILWKCCILRVLDETKTKCWVSIAIPKTRIKVYNYEHAHSRTKKTSGHNRGPPEQTYFWRSILLMGYPLEKLFGC